MKQIRRAAVANRGEIACRIIRTLRRLGITSIALYSEADEKALHVLEADEAVCIGPAPPKESYVNIQQVLHALRDSGADAVHPGYGFLSERAAFAEAVEEEGILFLGPDPDVIRAMGEKTQARSSMENAGVPVVPGRTIKDDAVQAAEAVGYPVMLKASSGGGGIGMQCIRSREELEKSAASISRRAETFFGSGELYIEKYLETPRHIEVQIAGDGTGDCRAVGLRDCSVQRRHQKVIEEAPASVTGEVRQKLVRSAVQAGSALKYRSVGTVEFLVENDDVYFLEMNTRLQVEHPVTELTGGMDLVEWQIRIAEGAGLEALPVNEPSGDHAVEARLYAEDPKTFFPSPGTITKWELPEEEGIRIDAGFRNGDTITPHYDPMLAKICAYAPDRETACRNLLSYMNKVRVEGIKTNRTFLIQVLENPLFQQGNYDVTLTETILKEVQP
ncbi:acetyl-CoA carboxylase biotin carboxylase subunit [Alkalicoccus urumqiensis]|uniref:Biotin carboxylase n=1 Tax=Alkalicoccus urumqiensis TaxID=1548213 RepID=A0A2P6MEE0_ALKUR|nr:biotin carboxylase N-terminal domain-containing protein [Alkalicoccus urumqiensis]PRO64659.1 biotin carboxylase [Alkalicoccus urumqiensis]